MATFKFLLQSKNNPANIYVRLSLTKDKSFKRKTGYVINPNDWSYDTSFPKQNDVDLKNLRADLKKLESSVETKLNEATKLGTEIDGYWLQEQIDLINNKKKKTDSDRLVNYFQEYIDSLPYKVYPRGKRGVSGATLKKYTTMKNKIIAFEEYKKRAYYIKDIDMRFRNELLEYFINVEKLNSNSAGRYIRFIKTICIDARENGIETHPQLDKIKGYSEEAEFTFLSFSELDKIANTSYQREALENAKDWLLIGCFIGQRVSDLLKLTKANIHDMNGFKMIVLTQQKTGKEVAIPVHDKIKPILEKRKWNFPSPLSSQKFNNHIKDIAKLAGLNEVIEGGKMVYDEEHEIWRKLSGKYEKWELVSSHICRRSFASNFYAITPTALLINITAHSTEKQFLEYIGKPAKDFSVQLAEYWQKEALMAKKEPVLNVVESKKRKAN